MERLTDGKTVPSNPISGAKLLEGEPSMRLYLFKIYNFENGDIFEGAWWRRSYWYVFGGKM